MVRETGRPPRPLAVVVLAAAEGRGLASEIPAPLHRIGSASLVSHVLRAVRPLRASTVTVIAGTPADRIASEARSVLPDVRIIPQSGYHGTVDAVRDALSLAEDAVRALVVFADAPLVRTRMLARLAVAPSIAVLSAEAPYRNPARGMRRGASIDNLIEASSAWPGRDWSAIAFDVEPGRRWLSRFGDRSANGTPFLAGLIELGCAEGARIDVEPCPLAEMLRVLSRRDLALAEEAFQERARHAAMAAGATMAAPSTVFLSWDTVIGRDVEIAPYVVIGPGVSIDDGARIEAFSHLEHCRVHAGARIGPFARLRPGADIGPGAHVGNFVEVKNTTLGAGAKANHLAYLGDATVGAAANIGAGAVTCNYDGAAKHRTEIGANAFIGTNSSLVAPVEIGAGAYVGSGSVITENVPDDALALGRARQVTKADGATKLRARRSAAEKLRSA